LSSSAILLAAVRGGSESPRNKSKKSDKKNRQRKSSSKKKKKNKKDKASNDDRERRDGGGGGAVVVAADANDDDESVDGNGTAAPETNHHRRDRINRALKETDAAQALGDAIRARADALRQQHQQREEDSSVLTATTIATGDPSLASLAWSLGASDYDGFSRADGDNRERAADGETVRRGDTSGFDADDAGGVEVAPGAVVASYFLKSHGGAHAIQSLCSLISAAAGIGSVVLAAAAAGPRRLPPPPAAGGGGRGGGLDPRTAAMGLILLRRSLAFALAKHVSGLAAAAWIAARAIPEVGFVRARSWIRQLAHDPVSQYCFYTALVLVWLPPSRPGNNKKNIDEWWLNYPATTLLLLGPILLREVISTALVICDVLVLLSLSSDGADPGSRVLRIASAVVNAGFSVLVTPRVWREAPAAERQRILARLVQKCSLAFEVAVGALLLVDAIRGTAGLLLAAENRPHLASVLKRCVCANLYLQFLLTRRRKIQKLASQIRGGAAHLPGYVLDLLLDPPSALGLQRNRDAELSPILAKRDDGTLTWRDYLRLAFD
jgi:hypothetical protein